MTGQQLVGPRAVGPFDDFDAAQLCSERIVAAVGDRGGHRAHGLGRARRGTATRGSWSARSSDLPVHVQLDAWMTSCRGGSRRARRVRRAAGAARATLDAARHLGAARRPSLHFNELRAPGRRPEPERAGDAAGANSSTRVRSMARTAATHDAAGRGLADRSRGSPPGAPASRRPLRGRTHAVHPRSRPDRVPARGTPPAAPAPGVLEAHYCGGAGVERQQLSPGDGRRRWQHDRTAGHRHGPAASPDRFAATRNAPRCTTSQRASSSKSTDDRRADRASRRSGSAARSASQPPVEVEHGARARRCVALGPVQDRAAVGLRDPAGRSSRRCPSRGRRTPRAGPRRWPWRVPARGAR